MMGPLLMRERVNLLYLATNSHRLIPAISGMMTPLNGMRRPRRASRKLRQEARRRAPLISLLPCSAV